MSKSKEIKTTRSIVHEILVNDPNSRNSDNYLLSKAYRELASEKNVDITGFSVFSFFSQLSDLELPTPETIVRARRWEQEHHPELRADADVEAMRMINEEVFRNIAISG